MGEEEQKLFVLVDNRFRIQIEHSYVRGEYSNILLKSMHPGKEDPSSSKKKKERHPFDRNFALWEQRLMIKYLIEKKLIARAKGYVVWKQMVEDRILKHRTYQSLHNHFRRCLLPRIDQFEMDSKNLKKFQQLR